MWDTSQKITKMKQKGWDVSQVEELLPSKLEAPVQTLVPPKPNKNKKIQTQRLLKLGF
jgi:hypothetical protein